jgi:predicted amidohydrolase YtcJ
MLNDALPFFMVMLLAAGPAHAQADYVLREARIYTASDEQPEAGALAVRDGRILMVGSESEVLDAYPDAPRKSAGGRAVVPGLIDAHAHLMGQGRSMMQADLVGTSSREDVVERLKAFAEERDLPDGAWLRGRGWDQNDWPDTDFPTRQALDEAFPERPVWLERIDGHAGWANTAALEAVGLDALRRMSDPEGGSIVRAGDGTPTGVFVDAATEIVASEIPPPTPNQERQALQLALETTARHGLTGVHDAGVDMATIRRYREAIDAGRFPLRVYAMIGGRGRAFDHFCDEGPLRGERLSVRSVKFYIDGALGSRGAALLDDYSDDPGNRGLLLQSPEEFQQNVRRGLQCGFQVNTHAIGDRGNRVVLDAYEQAVHNTGRTVGRHRIEHAQILSPQDLPRFAELDVIASMQPTHATSDMPWAGDRLGKERLRGAYAWQSLLDSGARLAFGSDFPVEDVDPLEGFYAAVTRQNAEGEPEGGWLSDERVSRRAALHGFTIDAAYAAFMEDEVGSLEPGKRADFVVLTKDIMQVPTNEILEAEVAATFLDGEAVYGDL